MTIGIGYSIEKAKESLPMKKLLKIIMGVLLVSITASELMACVTNRAGYEELAIQMLQEKYAEEFEIERYVGRQSMKEYFRVVAFSKKYPEVLFEAEVACDGSYVMDEYVASRVCHLAEEQIEHNLGVLQGYVQIKVVAVSKSIDSNNADMSIQEFMAIKTKNRFAVYLIFSPSGKETNKIYQGLSSALFGLECVSGNVQLYVTDEKILKKAHKYLSENANIEYEFTEVLEHIKPIEIPFENGVIQLSESEFKERAGDKL